MPYAPRSGRWRRVLRAGGDRSRTAMLFAVAWLVGVYALVRLTGGAPNPLVHLAYVGIIVAAMTGGLRSGIAVGLGAGILFGPLMPDSTAQNGTLLGTWGWSVRALAYLAAGLVAGELARRLTTGAEDLRTAQVDSASAGAARASEHRLRQLVQSSPFGVILFDREGRVTLVNRVAQDLLDVSERWLAETDGRLRKPIRLPSGAEFQTVGQLVRLAMDTAAAVPTIETDMVRSDGSISRLALAVTVIEDIDGSPIGAALSFRDVTARRALEALGIARIEGIQRAAAAASAEPTAAAAAERLLEALAATVPVVCSAIVVFEEVGARTLASWADPELGNLYPDVIPEAEAGHLRELVAAGTPVRLPLSRVVASSSALERIARAGGRSKVIVPLVDSLGLVAVLVAADRRDPDSPLGVEGEHLGDVGRICAAVVRRAKRDEDAELRDIRERVGRILEHPELLRPAYQPILSLRHGGSIVGYEALARFPSDPAQGPANWFAQANRVGLGAALQVVALRRQLAVARAARLPGGAFLSVNVSPQFLSAPEVMRTILDTGGIAPERLVLELTEEQEILDYPATMLALEPYRRAGIRVAVDDAGAGYASFRHVTVLQPHVIKLDSRLVTGFGTDDTRHALIRALAGFAAEVGALIVAEGIERPEELRQLVRVDAGMLAQGYAIALPGDPWPRTRPEATEVLRTLGAKTGRAGTSRAPAAPRSRRTGYQPAKLP